MFSNTRRFVLMRWPGLLFLLTTSLLLLHCQSTAPLTSAERDKLDPALERLLSGEPVSTDVYTTSTRGGETVYAVVIQTSDPDELRSADLPIASLNGNVATARLTVDQIRTAASYPFVRSISNSGQATPQSD